MATRPAVPTPDPQVTYAKNLYEQVADWLRRRKAGGRTGTDLYRRALAVVLEFDDKALALTDAMGAAVLECSPDKEKMTRAAEPFQPKIAALLREYEPRLSALVDEIEGGPATVPMPGASRRTGGKEAFDWEGHASLIPRKQWPLIRLLRKKKTQTVEDLLDAMDYKDDQERALAQLVKRTNRTLKKHRFPFLIKSLPGGYQLFPVRT